MIPYDYQVELSKSATSILDKYKILYLSMEERTGKSIIGLLALESNDLVSSVLIVTTKKAMEGWQETLSKCIWLTKNYGLINYHSIHKVDTQLYNALIFDEAHSYISGYPKKGVLWKRVKVHCNNKPIVYMSATPYAQGIQLLYHQLALSTYSPWKQHINFYSWYNKYATRDIMGNTEKIWVNGRFIQTYKKVNTAEAFDTVKHLFITKTRKSLGFDKEPIDVLHYIKLSKSTKNAYNILLKQKVLDFYVDDKSYTLIADSNMKLRTALHMLEGGVLKVDDDYIVLNIREKVDFILSKWGDNNKVAIMYQYIAEGNKLRAIFKNASVLQGTSNAEGIDLSYIENLIIYSQDFSTAKHTQRRARQANKNRSTDIFVHYLLVKKAVSAQVYKTVSTNKVNFIDSLFEHDEL